MNKINAVVLMSIFLLCTSVCSEHIFSTDFSGRSSLPAEWRVTNNSNGVSVLNDTLNIGAARVIAVFPESYALRSGTGASNQVSELWVRFRLTITPGSLTGEVIRLGLGDNLIVESELGRSASVHFRTYSTSNTLEFTSVAQNNQAATLRPEHVRNEVDVYCCLTDVGGQLKVDGWYNPSNSVNLGNPQVSRTAAYNTTYGNVFSRIEINAWFTESGHASNIREVVVGTTFEDVRPKVKSISLFLLH
ncbi:MAG: hypothetical protein WC959_09180 [Kiritimatiellales bacterium]